MDFMDFDKSNFAKRIKELRLAKNLTQEELSAKIGIEPSNYSNFETAKTTPSVQTLFKIIQSLEVSFDEVFELEHLKDEEILDEINLRVYNNFSIEQKRAIYKIFRSLEDFKR